MDGLAQFKQAQKESWKNFAPMASITTPAAARLVRYAGAAPGSRLLDVGCGTGVVAITAARLGARVSAIDLTPQLLEHARENARIAQVEVEWQEADVEELPFPDGQFDIVVSQFAHMFAPRPEVAVAQMLRVLRSGGTIAFSTWPPEMLVGRTSQLAARFMPPPPPGFATPMAWGDPQVIVQRLGSAVTDVVFERDRNLVPALSPAHFRQHVERSAGPVIKLVETLSATQPERLEAYRAEFDAIVSQYMRDNVIQQDYLLTRARKL